MECTSSFGNGGENASHNSTFLGGQVSSKTKDLSWNCWYDRWGNNLLLLPISLAYVFITAGSVVPPIVLRTDGRHVASVVGPVLH